MATISYARHRFLPHVIRHAVWHYLRFTVSYRDVEELLAERGLNVPFESATPRAAGSTSGRASWCCGRPDADADAVFVIGLEAQAEGAAETFRGIDVRLAPDKIAAVAEAACTGTSPTARIAVARLDAMRSAAPPQPAPPTALVPRPAMH